MPNEKYLDYAGLQYYHEKLNMDLASMLMTDDDLDIVLLDELGVAPPLPETWTESANGTLNLALGDAFSYWPEGAGTKTISITNGTTAGISKFFLKLTDAGNFPMQWGSNIQWKDGSEPEWQAFHEDIIMFKSDDSGSTWTAQVVQTNEITPYWKLTVQMPAHHYWNDGEVTRYRILLPFRFTNSAVIDWGDGTVETPETARPDINYEYCYHTYQADGIYHIKVQYDDFENLYIGNWLSTDYGVEYAAYEVMPAYLTSVVSIDSPLPKLKGSYLDTSSSWRSADNNFKEIFCEYDNLTSVPEKLFCNNRLVTSFQSCFRDCTSLQSIPSGLFDGNTAVTSFQNCFRDCTSLQSISSGLFDSNTAVTDFSYCFDGCTSLQSIPSGLFDNNTAVTTFYYCFYGCSSLQFIPSGLFDNNTVVTDFERCFYSCSSLQSIPSGLFNNNTAVTTFQNCFSSCTSLTDFTIHIGSSSVSNCYNFVTKKTGTTRTIYIPNNSTTKTTFDAQASSLGLTIIGE